jgi:glycosyltransferase involved in cell wall biosynthesis
MRALSNKNILVVSPEPWDHIFVSKHHYSVYLAKRGNRVFFLNPPKNGMSVKATCFLNVFTVEYRGFVNGLQYLPGPLRRFFVRLAYERLQYLCDARFDVVWSFDNSVFFDFNALPRGTLKISHIVDLNQDFQTRKAARTADYCFCTTELIKERLIKFNPRVAKINHGFHVPGVMKAFPRVSGRITAMYAGNLAMPYIDWFVLKDLVTSFEAVDFVFLGPIGEPLTHNMEMARAKQEVMKSNNAHFLGPVDSDLLQKYYQVADILLITYQEAYQQDQANPHKMMEYLGSGKMVVASFTSEYEDLSDKGLILMSKRNQELKGLFHQALQNLEFWNGEALQHTRRSFGLANTYDRQIERIEKIISE